MDFEEFKSTLMDLVTKEIEDRELDGISMKFDTINSPDGMTDRLIVSVGESKMSMAFRLQEIYTSRLTSMSSRLRRVRLRTLFPIMKRSRTTLI